MRIAVDAMGGDYAPEEIIKGAISALEERDLKIILLGSREKVALELSKYKFKEENLSVIDCKEYIESGEVPLNALHTKKDSSIVVGMNLLKNKEADTFISAGNSGAMMAAAFLILGCIPPLTRPAIPATFTFGENKVLLLDVGANVDCKPEHFKQFALMGSQYAQYIFKIDNPRVGLLNIGEEENKGNKAVQEAFAVLSNSKVNFVGNIEAKDIFKGKAEVIVCDGFVGNVLLKYTEALAKLLLTEINSRIIALLPPHSEMDQLRQNFRELVKVTDYTEYGGSLLLGVKGLCFVCHGRSRAKAIKNAIINATKFVDSNILQYLEHLEKV